MSESLVKPLEQHNALVLMALSPEVERLIQKALDRIASNTVGPLSSEYNRNRAEPDLRALVRDVLAAQWNTCECGHPEQLGIVHRGEPGPCHKVVNFVREIEALRAALAQAKEREEELTFAELRKVSTQRCAESFTVCADWTAADWGNALAGEVGEACNLIKKLRRGEPIQHELIADELADVVIYADLAAAFLGQDIAAAVVRKFNEVSDRVGSPLRLRAALSPEPKKEEPTLEPDPELLKALQASLKARLKEPTRG